MKRRDLARRLCSRIWLVGAAVVVLSLVSAGLTGCGGSQSEVSGVVSPTAEEAAQAGLTIEDAPSQTLAPTPNELPSPTASPTALPAPTVPAAPTATPSPTVVASPTAIPASTPTAVPGTSGFVLEHPDIPPEIEARILDRRYSPLDIPRAEEASDIQTYVKKIDCEEAASIAYVQNLIIQATSNEVDDQIDETVESIGQHSWSVPWKTGYLQFGYPMAIDPCKVEVESASEEATVWWFPSLNGEPYLLMSVSDDGNSWTSPVRFSVPFTLSPLQAYGEEVRSPQILVASNGNHLLLAMEEASIVKVFASTDLDEWDQFIIPFHRPDELHPMLGVSLDLEDVILGPNGWLIVVTITMRLDIGRVLPDDVKEDIARVSYLWSSWENGEEGFHFEWYSVDGSIKQRFFSSEEWGMSHEVFFTYGSEFGNKPYLQSRNFSRWVWPEVWDDKTSVDYPDNWTELPYIGAKRCCDIIGTSAGYIALTEPYFAGYNPLWSGTQWMFFSRDGYEWVPIETPKSTHMKHRFEQGDNPFTFIWSIRNHEDVVIVSGNWYLGLPGDGPGDPIMWIIDPDGTNWREVESTEFEMSGE